MLHYLIGPIHRVIKNLTPPFTTFTPTLCVINFPSIFEPFPPEKLKNVDVIYEWPLAAVSFLVRLFNPNWQIFHVSNVFNGFFSAFFRIRTQIFGDFKEGEWIKSIGFEWGFPMEFMVKSTQSIKIQKVFLYDSVASNTEFWMTNF